MSYFKKDWLGLDWTDWIPLKTTPKVRKIIPTSQGVYRIRADGYSGIIYIGQTTNLKTRTASLSNNSHKKTIPLNDPHTAAPNLWVWKNEENWRYELSISETELTTQNREAFECFLLWKYRLEHNQSTLCNHGRFHPDYIKSGNKKTKLVGRKLRANEPRNPSGGPSQPPLESVNKPLNRTWMGVEWSPIRPLTLRDNIPRSTGLYKIINEKKVVYIGETEDLVDRCRSHNRRFKDHHYSFSVLDQDTLYHQRHELENDLIGCYYQIHTEAPERQFKRKN